MIKMTIEERIKATLARHPDWDDLRIARSVESRKTEVATVRAGGSLLPFVDSPHHQSFLSLPKVAGPASVESVSGLVSLEKVVARYDVKQAILREIAVLPEGSLMNESEMCLHTAGQDRNRFRRTVENNDLEFKSFRIKLKLDDSTEGKWYWGKQATVAEALRLRDL